MSDFYFFSFRRFLIGISNDSPLRNREKQQSQWLPRRECDRFFQNSERTKTLGIDLAFAFLFIWPAIQICCEPVYVGRMSNSSLSPDRLWFVRWLFHKLFDKLIAWLLFFLPFVFTSLCWWLSTSKNSFHSPMNNSSTFHNLIFIRLLISTIGDLLRSSAAPILHCWWEHCSEISNHFIGGRELTEWIHRYFRSAEKMSAEKWPR
jgi:hypothetical protein